jgi:hypothetical protein
MDSKKGNWEIACNRAKQFYAHYGFQVSPQHPMTLMLRLNSVKV